MAMRLTGLMSGMDTESIIKELVAVKQTKVDSAKKAQTKLQWKQDAWKDLNTKIHKLYTSSLSDMRFYSSYSKKATKVSNSSAVSVITGEKAVNGTQSLKIQSLAKTGYLTGSQLNTKQTYNGSTSLTDIEGVKAGSKIGVKVGGNLTEIEITEGMTISSLTQKLQSAGVNASFDEKNQRFFISSKESGKDNDFTLMGVNGDGVDALVKLGVGNYADLTKYASGTPEVSQDQIDATVAARLKNILSNVESVENKVSDIVKKMQDYGMENISGLSAVDLNDKIEEFKATGTYDDLDQADKDKIASYQEQLGNYAEDLQTYKESYDVKEDGTKVASQGLISSVTDELGEMANGMNAAAMYAAEKYTVGDFAGEDASQRINGTNAVIILNGARFESEKNTFEVNGLTFNVNALTAEGEEITVTTQDDTDGIYDMIKNFLKQYNSLINEMDKLYNAASAKGYEPLTDDEKGELSDDAIAKWEDKIKESLLRKDSTLNTVSSAMREIMSSSVTMSNGSKMYLSDFGISTLGYFSSADNEKNAYHIDGDSDDANTSGNADKLKTMIANNPDTVVDFFVNLSKSLYGKLDKLMQRTEYSSAYKVYNDKSMQKDYDDYTTKIADLEAKLKDYEDKWYKKFGAMETALAKLQSNASAVTSLLGGS